MAGLLEDVRFGARLLTRSPGFAAVALATLALGVGLNAAMFSLVRSIMLRPLPYPHAARIVVIDETFPRLPIEDPGVSAANFMDWRARNHVFDEMALVDNTALNLTGVGEPERLEAAQVSAGAFPLLGVWPAVGRAFGEEENRPGAGRSVVVGWRLWQRRFGGSSAALGRTVVLSGRSYTIIGVMPAGFAFPRPRTEIWLPIEPDLTHRGNHGAMALARLKPGLPLRQAQAEMEGLERAMAAEFPEVGGWSIRLTPWRDQVTGPVRTPLLVLMGAVV